MTHTPSDVVLHIGMHKSASTYLQSKIFKRIPVNYVFFSGYRKEVIGHLQRSDGFDPSFVVDWVNSEIEKRYANAIQDVDVLSHEELSGHPHGYPDVDQYSIASNLKLCYPDAKVLIVVRNQMKYLTSIYAFRVAIKGEEYRSFYGFLDSEGRKGLFEKLEYDRLISHYMSLFGKERVLVLPMELLAESQVEFNKRVTDFIGVPPVVIGNNKKSNESTNLYYVVQFWRPFNYLASVLLRGLKRIKPETNEEYPYMRIRYLYYGLKRKASGILRYLLKSTRTLDIEAYSGYQDLVRRYSRSNRRLQELTGLKLSGYGYLLDIDHKHSSVKTCSSE